MSILFTGATNINYLEVKSPIILRIGEDIVGNTVREDLVLIRASCRVIDTVNIRVYLALQPRNEQPPEDETTEGYEGYEEC